MQIPVTSPKVLCVLKHIITLSDASLSGVGDGIQDLLIVDFWENRYCYSIRKSLLMETSTRGSNIYEMRLRLGRFVSYAKFIGDICKSDQGLLSQCRVTQHSLLSFLQRVCRNVGTNVFNEITGIKFYR